jgi:UPF0755 protein
MLALLAALAVAGAGRTQYLATGPSQKEEVVFIPRGSTVDGIADRLVERGIIANRTVFVIAARLAGQQGNGLDSGEYRIPARASMREVVEIMSSGRVIQHGLTVPEGLTSLQIVQRLQESDLLTGDVRDIPREGSLLPDTYFIQRGDRRVDVLRRMQEAQTRVLREVWQRRVADIPVRTPEELVTLASIVEKETGKADERARVAGVFVNRLRRNMRLESDPTIIYGIVGGRGSLGRPILASEIRAPTPYNTYVIPGLPPGPIANPGRAAMEAVANPARHNEIFFVADGTGGHAFAETLQQHNANVARWRAIEAASRAGQPAPGGVVAGPGAGAPAPVPPASAPRPLPATQPATPPRPAQPQGFQPQSATPQSATPPRGANAPQAPAAPPGLILQ